MESAVERLSRYLFFSARRDADMSGFFDRLKQRKLVQWALAYVAAAFALIQVLDIVAQRFRWPEATVPIVILILGVGFFVALVLAWYHGERGAQRVSTMEVAILGVLLLCGGALAWQFEKSREGKADTAHVHADVSERQSHRRAAVRQHVDRCGERIFSRRIVRGNPQFAGAHRRHAGGRAHFVVPVQGQERGPARRRRKTRRRATCSKAACAAKASARASPRSSMRTSDGIHIWSQTYDRTLKDTLAVQLDIAEQVAGVLDVVLDDAQRDAHARRRRQECRRVHRVPERLETLYRCTPQAGSPTSIERCALANVEFVKATAARTGIFVGAFAEAAIYTITS